MKTKHEHRTHSCECEHKNVKFCKKCQVCHCLDCNQEWTAKPTTTWTYTYPWTWYYTQPQTEITWASNTINGSQTVTVDNDTCSH